MSNFWGAVQIMCRVFLIDKWFYKNGNQEAIGYYLNGQKNGKWPYYQENGGLKQIENYKEGKAHGEWLWYFPNGALACKGTYKNGLVTVCKLPRKQYGLKV